MNYRERIVRDPRIAGGQAVFKGTRVTLRTVLASLAEGATATEILADFRDHYAESLEDADTYLREFNKAVERRLPPFALEIENR